jgi:hypothetical protein
VTADPSRIQAEYRGGPIATIRLLADAWLRPDPVWKSIQPSRPGDYVRPNHRARAADKDGKAQA